MAHLVIYLLDVYTKPMNISQEVGKLNLMTNSYVVVGSGILGALGIRESNDIDLIVSQNVFDDFEAQGWAHDSWPDQPTLTNGLFELGVHWYGKRVDELLENAQYIDSIPYLSLEDVYEWKKRLGRDKDLRDLGLIENYRVGSTTSEAGAPV